MRGNLIVGLPALKLEDVGLKRVPVYFDAILHADQALRAPALTLASDV